MIGRGLVTAAGMAALVAASPAAARGDSPQVRRAEARLEAALVEALRAEGPFFNAEERELVERACAYPAGSWNGYEFSMTDGVLHCTNGLDVDSPEIRAMMEAAAPRIGRRIAAAVARPRVRSAIAAAARARRSEETHRRVELNEMFRDPQRQNIPAPRPEPPQLGVPRP